jgi:predicted transcriptional regulator
MTATAELSKHETDVLKKVPKRGRSSLDIAVSLGYTDARSVSRALGRLMAAGLIRKDRLSGHFHRND